MSHSQKTMKAKLVNNTLIIKICHEENPTSWHFSLSEIEKGLFRLKNEGDNWIIGYEANPGNFQEIIKFRNAQEAQKAFKKLSCALSKDNNSSLCKSILQAAIVSAVAAFFAGLVMIMGFSFIVSNQPSSMTMGQVSSDDHSLSMTQNAPPTNSMETMLPPPQGLTPPSPPVAPPVPSAPALSQQPAGVPLSADDVLPEPQQAQ